MIEEVVSIELPVHERMVIKKNRLTPKDYAGEPVPRISIVTGIHGDELDGQYVCYEVIRRVNNNLERLKGIIDIYPDVNPLGIDTGSRGIPMFELDMNRVFPGDNNGAVAESVAAGIVNDIIGSDFCLDIHSSNIFVNEMPQVRINDDTQEKLLPYAKMMNLLPIVLIILVCLLLLRRWVLETELRQSIAGILLMVYLTLCLIWGYGMMSRKK